LRTARSQKELLEPALKGTLSVLRAAKDCGVYRVVLMSSKSAMLPNPAWPADKVIVEDDCWADLELLKKRQVQAYSTNVHCCYVFLAC
jgi:nucleoside-diphosphate-sugar epimerase